VPVAHGQASGTCSRLPADPNAGLVFVGRVGRPHGVDGAFVVEQASEAEVRFAVGGELVVDGESAVVALSRRVGGGRHAVKLDRSVARGTPLYVRRDDLPPLGGDSYYVADLVGLVAIDELGEQVGIVADVLPGPANDVLELDTGLLLPLVEDCVREVDLPGGRILLNPGFTR
jgi:16S rRNA processing protein RimM